MAVVPPPRCATCREKIPWARVRWVKTPVEAPTGEDAYCPAGHRIGRSPYPSPDSGGDD